MLTAIVHALYNTSGAAALSYLLFQCTGRADAVAYSMVPAMLRSKIMMGDPIRKGLATP